MTKLLHCMSSVVGPLRRFCAIDQTSEVGGQADIGAGAR
jgi:hypothetical protein